MSFEGSLSETLVAPATKDALVDEVATLSSPNQELFKGKKDKKKGEHVRVNVDDEFNTSPAVEIDVLQSIILEAEDNQGQKVTEDLTDRIRSEFKFLSATKALEVGSARSDIIQDYVDKMVQGDQEWEGKVRVVIMNKGNEPTAFAYPDGTIFISQSLINLYDSLDEVIGIMAHEVKHLTNGTTRAAFKSEAKRGSSLGVGWLHEMTSDFGSPELLEKVGLKSTATADVLTKLADHFGNRRGTEHQAPVLRAIQQLGLHAVKDYETSHIDYTKLPSELRRASRMTNFEAIIDAAVRDDVEAVEIYLGKLHPRDLGQFFDVADGEHYYGLSEVSPEKGTGKEVAKKVGALVVQRLMADGMSPDEVKLFFLSVTRGYSNLSPSFKDLTELQGLAPLAEKMFKDGAVKTATQKVFGREQGSDSLKDILCIVNYRFDSFTDKEAVFFTDIDSIADFIGTVNELIKNDLPPVKDVSFVDSEGNLLKYDSNRVAQVHEDLKNVLFNYIKRYFLPDIPDGDLDQQQIEDIFQAVKDVGFEPLTSSYYFPIDEKKIGPESRKIIELAYKKVYGKELIRRDDGKEVSDLPTPAEFKQQMEGKSRWDIEQLLTKYAYDHELDAETKAEYVQVGLEYFDEYDFARSPLEALVGDKIGYSAMKNWREHGDPKWDTFSRNRSMNSMQEKLHDIFVKASGQTEASEKKDEPTPRKLTIDELIQEYGLDREALYEEARRKGEIERTSSQIEFVANTIASSEERLFGFVESIMERTKADVKTFDQYQLLAICNPLFKLANEEGTGVFKRDRISNFDRFYKLRFVQDIVGQIEKVHFENIQDMGKYVKEAKNKYSQRPINGKFSLYEDDVYSVLLAKPVRDELHRLTEPGSLRRQDYPALVELLNENFPYSPQRRELIKALQTAYINDPDVGISDKMDFFFKEYKLLGFEGAVLVAEQIVDIPTYRGFKQRLDQLAIEYVSGEESLDGVASTDIASSILTQKADLLIKTASGSASVAKEVSTDLAIQWVKTYLGENEWRKNDISYDKKSGKFILTETGRSAFSSFDDTLDYFKGLSDGKKLAIALKAMSDQDGLLVSEEGRNLLERMLVEGLGLKDEFFRQALTSAIKKGDAKVVGLPAAQMLVPFMFRALNTDSVDMRRVRNVEFREKQEGDTVYKKVKNKDYSEDLPRLLGSSTRDIRYFGFRYHHQPDSVIGKQAQESGDIYFETLDNLREQIVSPSESVNRVESSLPTATEAMIKAGETSPVFVRGMQMAVQLINFEPNVRERLSQTQDSMKGMEKLRFWDNLLSKAQGDVELARFLEQDLISLDSYLGGGSLFTTYGATVKSEDGSSKKVVIKMLNPNAEEFIRLSYNFSSTVLGEVEQNTRGKTRQNARLAGSLLDLSNTWCIRDINDSTYAERDDAFRSTVQSYNEKTGKTSVDAPERRYTSKKVKVEDQYEGTTLNKFLASSEVGEDQKQEVVNNLLGFFDHQFQFSPTTTPDGKKVFIFHSDPHAGNYMIDPSSADLKLGAIDRSMYLALEEKDVQMFKLLKEGNGATFINEFIGRCLEVSGIQGAEATRVKYSVLNQLGGELVRQRLGGRTDTSAYLQIIMQEFTNYGERYTPVETVSELSPIETIISDFLKKNTGTDALNAYDNLKAQLLNGENGTRSITYLEFRQLLGEMQKKGAVGKKAIEIPIEYRLMIRNIIAMQNLQQRWAS